VRRVISFAYLLVLNQANPPLVGGV
jgi:hypothetical protein